jgi:hypothetical protein
MFISICFTIMYIMKCRWCYKLIILSNKMSYIFPWWTLRIITKISVLSIYWISLKGKNEIFLPNLHIFFNSTNIRLFLFCHFFNLITVDMNLLWFSMTNEWYISIFISDIYGKSNEFRFLGFEKLFMIVLEY